MEEIKWVNCYRNLNYINFEIGRKKHKKNKLRNALVHGRWYFSSILNELSLFDYIKEYDYNFKAHIKLSKIYDFICKKIDLDKEKQKKNS